MIRYDEVCGTFTLHTRHTTYQMKVSEYGVLLHTYYGPRVRDCDLSCLVQRKERSFSPNPHEAGGDRSFSLDVMPQEYSTCGVGDFRLSSLEFELPCGSRTADLRYAGFRQEAGKYALEGLPAFYGEGAETLVVTLEDAAAGAAVELYYGVFAEYDLITRAVRVVNRGSETLGLCRCASLCLDFTRSDMDLITFDGKHTTERCLSRAPLRPGVQSVGSIRGASSHQHNPFVVLCDRDAGEDRGLCYGAMLLYSGNFEAAAERDQFESCRLVMGIHPYHFRWTLAPGESFTAPEAALICSSDGLGEMSRRFHRAIREHLLRDPGQGRRKPVLINNWEATYFDFTTEKLLTIAGEAAALGVELFVLDDGWFGVRNDDNSGLGDWYVNTSKLPGGLEALVPRLHDLGLSFGIWVEPEMVNEDSDLYRAHPDWALRVPGRAPARGRGQLVLDFSRREVRDHVYARLREVLSSVPVRYVKWDMNRSLSDVWSAALPAGRQGEVYHRFVLGVYEVLERMRRDFPELLIEGCCGGGGRFDGGMLYYAPQIWCSDNTDAIDRLAIQYGTSFCYPACTMGSHVSASPNEQNGRATPLAARAIAAMSGAFGYEMDLSRCTAEEKEEIRSQIRTYRDNWDLFHLGDYYRLTDLSGPFVAWEQVSRDKRRAVVSLVAGGAQAAPPFRTLRLKGLDQALTYRVNGGDAAGGDVLMHAGVPLLPLWGDYQSLQLFLEAVEE